MSNGNQERPLEQSMSGLKVGSSSGSHSSCNDIRHALRQLTEFYAKVSRVKCRRCQAVIVKDLDFEQHVRQWAGVARQSASSTSSYTAILSDAACSKCKTSTCLGCGGKTQASGNTVSTGLYTLTWCCDQGRLVSIWILLCWSDLRARQQLLQEAKASQSKRPFQPAEAGLVHHPLLGLMNVAPPQKKGTGYGGGIFPMFGGSDMSCFKLKEADRKVDSRDEDVIVILTAHLPSIDGRHPMKFDRHPPSTLSSVLLLSSVLEQVSTVVRNDSIEDAVKRKDLYSAALDCVERLGGHAATTQLITAERESKTASAGLYAISMDGGTSSLELSDPKEGKTSSVAAAMKNIVSLAGSMNAASDVMRKEFEDSESKAQLRLCRRISKVIQTLYSTAPDGVFTTRRAAADSPGLQRWNDYQRSNRMNVVDDKLVQSLIVHKKMQKEWGQPGYRRMARLVSEIGSMAMSLPDGIFVRAGGNRPDHMRVAVIGPEGTPYFGGIFEFDVLCGLTYPGTSPSIMFRVQEGVTVLNPNLHEDGEVCLSLLGTWMGAPMENWQPNISTLYQVLVSMQGFIFTANPAENEPGGISNNNEYSSKLAMCVHMGTVAGYILPWLTKKKKDAWTKELWSEMAQKYYAAHGAKILRSVQQAAASNPVLRQTAKLPGPFFGPLMGRNPGIRNGRNLVQELEAALGSLT